MQTKFSWSVVIVGYFRRHLCESSLNSNATFMSLCYERSYSWEGICQARSSTLSTVQKQHALTRTGTSWRPYANRKTPPSLIKDIWYFQGECLIQYQEQSPKLTLFLFIKPDSSFWIHSSTVSFFSFYSEQQFLNAHSHSHSELNQQGVLHMPRCVTRNVSHTSVLMFTVMMCLENTSWFASTR